jgi:hypothetical protein
MDGSYQSADPLHFRGRSMVGGIPMLAELTLLARILVLTALTGLFQIDRAPAESLDNSRLLFDPLPLDGGSTPPSLAEKGVLQLEKQNEAWITPPAFDLPGLSAGDLVTPNPPTVLAAPKPQSSPATPFGQGLKVGTFSVGVEASAVSKPRTVVGDEPYADMNTLIDQRRQSGFAPFVGLSAKSTLQ